MFCSWNRSFPETVTLANGDVLLLESGGQVKVSYAYSEQCKISIKVYNLEVEDFHTYYVGEDGILVHNTCSVSSQRRKAIKEVSKQ